MGDHRQKRIEEIAAEITGPIVDSDREQSRPPRRAEDRTPPATWRFDDWAMI